MKTLYFLGYLFLVLALDNAMAKIRKCGADIEKLHHDLAVRQLEANYKEVMNTINTLQVKRPIQWSGPFVESVGNPGWAPITICTNGMNIVNGILMPNE